MRPNTIRCADARLWLPTLPAACCDCCVTDPPYGLRFMGKKWDSGAISRDPDFWRAVLRVLKPGAWLLVFGGTRSWHRLACALEDAGFEMRDTVLWLYGQGFPKSQSCLKPAWEPILLAKAPGPLRALRLNACAIIPAARKRSLIRTTDMNGRMRLRKGRAGPRRGRWPANLAHDGGDEIVAEFRTLKGIGLTGARGGGKANTGDPITYNLCREPRSRWDGIVDNVGGSAARFYYVAKASRAEREAGLREAGLREAVAGALRGRHDGSFAKDARVKRRNTHPTVKPLALMRWLVRLIAAPGSLVLDPLCGSGSTLIAARQEGCNYLGCEQERAYVRIARARVAAWSHASHASSASHPSVQTPQTVRSRRQK